MSKRRQGPINKRLDFISNKLHKKIHCRNSFNISWCYFDFGHADNEAKAAEENHMENTLNSIENDNDKIIKN